MTSLTILPSRRTVPASRRPLARTAFLVLSLALFLPGAAFCQSGGAQGGTTKADYLIGSEDVLSLSVWEHPELSRTVAVRADGSFTFPPIGQVDAIGRTTTDLARTLEKKIYDSLRLTTQVTVSVVAFNSQKIYLAGQVAAPGKYSFETIPSLVDLLGTAGGINPQADLSQVKILRRTDSGSTSIPVDLTLAVQTGDMSQVPKLQSGDLVMVPGANANTGALGGASVVYVLGAVGRPGPYNAVPGMDLMQLLAVAGGVTERGDMGKVEVTTGGTGGNGYHVRIDLSRQPAPGSAPFLVRAGDTVFVPTKGTSTAGFAWTALRESLGLTSDIFLIHNVATR